MVNSAKNKNIHISVVIPTFNSESFIIRTLKTVFNQTVLPYEIIIVDDGSKDKTLKKIRSYIAENQQIIDNFKIIEQPNSGAGAARNNGIKYATGEWISFLDSDDIWDRRKIEMVSAVIRKHPDITVIAHDEYIVDEKNFRRRKLCSSHKRYKKEENLFLQLYKKNLFSTSCMTVRKDILEMAGLFDETLRSAQDYDLWIRIAQYGKLYYMNQPLETYVTREGNITANTYRRYQCELKICRKYINDLKELLSKRDVKRIVRGRIFFIHKVEAYLSIRKGKIKDFIKIMLRIVPEMAKRI